MAKPNLLGTRANLMGRLVAMRLGGAPVPRYKGFHLWSAWARTGPFAMAKGIASTLRRVWRRRLFTRVPAERAS